MAYLHDVSALVIRTHVGGCGKATLVNGLLGGLLLRGPSGSVLQWLAAREEERFMGRRTQTALSWIWWSFADRLKCYYYQHNALYPACV